MDFVPRGHLERAASRAIRLQRVEAVEHYIKRQARATQPRNATYAATPGGDRSTRMYVVARSCVERAPIGEGLEGAVRRRQPSSAFRGFSIREPGQLAT
jgi:hypothetical protein